MSQKPPVNTPDTIVDEPPAFGDGLLGNSPIWTPEIGRLTQAISLALRLGFVGLTVNGQQRLGKSAACRYVQEHLPQILRQPLACFLWSLATTCKTERDFYQERAMDSGCLSRSNRDIALVRGRLFDHIADSAVHNGGHRAVILIDEAHALNREQFSYLVHCDNQLRLRRIKPFFVLVGQPELLVQSETWEKSMGYQVVGRFFSRRWAYQGISLDEMQVVLERFDEPERGSEEATYAGAVREAYAAGWRLSHLAKTLTDAISTIAQRQSIAPSDVRVPMEHLRAMLLACLLYISDRGGKPTLFNVSSAVQAVEMSNFPSAMHYYVDRHNGQAAAA